MIEEYVRAATPPEHLETKKCVITSSISKKLDGLERLIRFRRPRFITMLVDGTRPTDEAAEAAFLQPLDLQAGDIVVAVKKFVEVEGLPKIQSERRKKLMPYQPDKPKGVTVRSGETRHAGECQSQPLKHNPGREMHPDRTVRTHAATQKGSHKGTARLPVTDKQNQTSVHPQGRNYHPDKSVKHHPTGVQNTGRNNPAPKGGSHKSIRPSGSHKGR